MQFSIIYLMGIMYVGSAKNMNNMNKVFIRIYLWVSLHIIIHLQGGVDLFIECAR